MDFGLVCPPGDGEPLRRFNRPDDDFGGLPTWDDVEACLSIDNFDNWPYDANAPNSFRCALEGFRDPHDTTVVTASMHNLVHIFCGGTLNNIFEASNDPLFPCIHVYVDKIFESWLRDHEDVQYPTGDVPLGHRATEKMVPFLPLFENQDLLKPCRTFGYDYVYDE
ncbi:tyrosinase-like [Heterodontus francisci]|uniref:tyrosinase-like n=1 Tax=Heterodontus francisci TaxID=7792 RepID=UPI00355B75A8